MNVVPDHLHADQLVSGDPAQGFTVATLADMALRRWRVVLVTLVACLLLAGLYLATTPNRYSAKSVLLIDTRQAPASPLEGTSEAAIDPAVVDSQLEILKSERIAEHVVDRLHLERDPEFAGGPPSLTTRLVAMLTGRTLSPPTDASRRAAAADALTHKLKITRLGRSYVAEITSTTLAPAQAAATANAVADAYIQDELDSALKANERTVAWMNRRVAEVKGQAAAAAEALAAFDRQAGPTPPDAAARDRRQALAASADAARADAQALENRALRLGQFIQQQALPVTGARVLAYADPPTSKSAPKSTVIVLLAGVGGLVLGLGLAVLRGTLDRRWRSSEALRADLGLPVAGTLPVVRGSHHGVASLFDARRPWCRATETLRALKVSLDHALRSGTSGGLTIGLASAWPGEGKSTLAANLALLLAETGTRVLVVDADLRKPDVSADFGFAAPRGLVDVIDDGATLESCVQRMPDGIDVLGRGPSAAPLHPFDLLGSRRMQGALALARGRYDYILVDLPSLLSSVDAQAVAPLLDAFVLVTEYGRTSRDDLARALSTSPAVAARLAVAVLNKVRSTDRRLARMSRRKARRPVPMVSA